MQAILAQHGLRRKAFPISRRLFSSCRLRCSPGPQLAVVLSPPCHESPRAQDEPHDGVNISGNRDWRIWPMRVLLCLLRLLRAERHEWVVVRMLLVGHVTHTVARTNRSTCPARTLWCWSFSDLREQATRSHRGGRQGQRSSKANMLPLAIVRPQLLSPGIPL